MVLRRLHRVRPRDAGCRSRRLPSPRPRRQRSRSGAVERHLDRAVAGLQRLAVSIHRREVLPGDRHRSGPRIPRRLRRRIHVVDRQHVRVRRDLFVLLGAVVPAASRAVLRDPRRADLSRHLHRAWLDPAVVSRRRDPVRHRPDRDRRAHALSRLGRRVARSQSAGAADEADHAGDRRVPRQALLHSPRIARGMRRRCSWR